MLPLFPRLFSRHYMVRTGSAATSFMVMTLSSFSGQETSECNGSAGRPPYKFMNVQGWKEGSTHLLLFFSQNKRQQ